MFVLILVELKDRLNELQERVKERPLDEANGYARETGMST